jgi:hypothetical protein
VTLIELRQDATAEEMGWPEGSKEQKGKRESLSLIIYSLYHHSNQMELT